MARKWDHSRVCGMVRSHDTLVLVKAINEIVRSDSYSSESLGEIFVNSVMMRPQKLVTPICTISGSSSVIQTRSIHANL